MLKTPIILITGAAKGIGRVLALSFSSKACQLILLDKNKNGLETLHDALQVVSPWHKKNPPLLIHANLKKLDLIDQMGAALYQKFGRLDGLLSCHGILEQLGPVAQYDRKIFDQLMLVNFTTNFRLIQSLDPLFQQSKAAKLMFLTCESASGVKPFWGAYAASKSALETLVQSYAAEQKIRNIQVELFEPGKVSTELRFKAFPGEKEGEFKLAAEKIAYVQDFFESNHSTTKQAC